MMKMTFPHFSLAVLLILVFLMCDSAGCKERPVMGGNCVDKKYKGTATITGITAVEHEGRQGQAAFEVKFIFTPHEAINEPFAQVEGREFELVASDFPHFSRGFLEKHGIEEGSTLDCYLNVITQGTCTPAIFEFPELKRDEYTVK